MHSSPTAEASTDAEAAFWRDFGFDVACTDQGLKTTLPTGVVAFRPVTEEDEQTLWHFTRNLGPLSNMYLSTDKAALSLFRIAADTDVAAIRTALPPGITLTGEGDRVDLPTGDDFRPANYAAGKIDELKLFTLPPTAEPETAVPSEAEPVMPGNPMTRYSLQGHLPELEAAALETKPLLGNVALAGQATVIYAPPGSGKTLLTIWLLMDAIRAGRVFGGNVYYMNADDSSSGVADKMRLLEEVGAHMLVPGLLGFTAGKLLELMRDMVKTNKCRGVVIVVDTLKKVVDTMDKRDSAAFGGVVRECVAQGATFIGLGHTRKNPSPTGKLVHGGTTDLLEDADAACILTPLNIRTGDGDKVVQFLSIKRRGDNVDEAFAYAEGGTASYDELITSVRRVDPDKLDHFVVEAEERSDEPVIDVVIACIADGIVQKMALADTVGRRAKISSRAAIRVIERYQGDDPAQHRWTYSVGERGAKLYRLFPT